MNIYDADARAHKITEAAAEAWYQSQGSGDYDVAVGVIAALALTGRGPGDGDPAKLLAKQSDDGIVQMLREIWSLFWTTRPELGRLVGPIAGWVNDDEVSPHLAHGIAAVARAAARAGLLEMAHNGSVRDCDVIGAMYIQMRSKGAREARGEFYTPPNLCKMMALMALGSKDGGLEPGMSIAEPAAGTGGMFRAAAEVIREQGMNPADFWWYGNDISAVSVAGLAVNCHVWGLGPNVVIGVADSLAEPDWYERAWREQQEVTAHRDQLWQQAKMLAAFRALFVGEPDPDAAEPAALPPAPEPTAPRRPPLPKGPVIQLSLFADPDSEAS